MGISIGLAIAFIIDAFWEDETDEEPKQSKPEV